MYLHKVQAPAPSPECTPADVALHKVQAPAQSPECTPADVSLHKVQAPAQGASQTAVIFKVDGWGGVGGDIQC